MDQIQIMSGFSDIKRQFSDKRKITKPPRQLRLWFTFQDNILFVHDYHEHIKSMVLAIKSNSTWENYLIEKSLGAILVNDYIQKYENKELDVGLAQAMNDGFISHGFFPS